MSENVCPNSAQFSDRKRKPRFSLPASDHGLCFARNKSGADAPSLLQQSQDASPFNSPSNSSSDGEWAKFQAALSASKAQSQLLNEEDSDVSASFEDSENDGVARVLSFESPTKKRMSIGTIKTQRDELALMKRDMELDEEIAALQEQQGEMEEAFLWMMAEVTQQRITAELSAKGAVPKGEEVYKLANSLDLRDVDHLNWAATIEKAIETYMV